MQNGPLLLLEHIKQKKYQTNKSVRNSHNYHFHNELIRRNH